MSNESLKLDRSEVSPVSEGEVEKRLCMDDLHESFSSVGGSDPVFDGLTILEPESISQLHSTILDSADSAGLDGVDQQVNQQEGMSVKDSLKEACERPCGCAGPDQRHYLLHHGGDPHTTRSPGEEGGEDR